MSSTWTSPSIGQLAKYMLSVCCCHFGFARAGDWVKKDLNAWQEEFGGAPCCSIQASSASSAKPLASAHQSSSSTASKRQRTNTAVQVRFR